MDTLVVISAVPTITVLLIGFVVFAREQGYSFDLRRKSRPLPFGRRDGDQRVRVQTSPG